MRYKEARNLSSGCLNQLTISQCLGYNAPESISDEQVVGANAVQILFLITTGKPLSAGDVSLNTTSNLFPFQVHVKALVTGFFSRMARP